MATMAEMIAAVKKQRAKQAKGSKERKALRQFKRANDPTPSNADRLAESETSFETMEAVLTALGTDEDGVDQSAYNVAMREVLQGIDQIPDNGAGVTKSKLEANIRAVLAHAKALPGTVRRCKRALREHFAEPDTREADMVAAIALLDGDATLTQKQITDALQAIEEGKEFLTT